MDFRRRLRLLILGGMNNIFVQGSVVCSGFDDEDSTILTLDDLLNGFQKLEEEKATTSTASTVSSIVQHQVDPEVPTSPVVHSLPRKIAIEEGMNYITGFLLHKAGWEEKVQKDKTVPNPDIVESKWIDALNTGGLSYPARSIVEDVKRMDQEFVRFHKKTEDGLLRGPNITKTFADTLAFIFPHYPIDFLKKFSFARTMWRLRQVRLDMSGSKESARSKKKCIDFAY